MDEAMTIDVRGLKCPLPVLKTAKRMSPLAAGARVVVLTTDPMAAIDIPHYRNYAEFVIDFHGLKADFRPWKSITNSA